MYELWKCMWPVNPLSCTAKEVQSGFDKHPRVGGACGKYVSPSSYVFQASDTSPFRVSVSTGQLALASPLATAQSFEYKMSNIFDKPLEVSADKLGSL